MKSIFKVSSAVAQLLYLAMKINKWKSIKFIDGLVGMKNLSKNFVGSLLGNEK